MSESAEKEPTMEEILSSIRRIISEDDDEAPQAAAAPEDDEDEPAPAVEVVEDEDVLELTDPVDAAPEPEIAAEPETAEADDDIMVIDSEDEGDFGGEVSFEPEPDTEMAGIGEAAPEPQVAAAQLAEHKPEPIATTGAKPVSWNESDKLVGDVASSAASSAFANLTRSTRVADEDNRTLEAIVRELLRPMLKDWLEANLPAIVEKKVQEEVERIARGR